MVKAVVRRLDQKGMGVEASQPVTVRPPTREPNKGRKKWGIVPCCHNGSTQIPKKYRRDAYQQGGNGEDIAGDAGLWQQKGVQRLPKLLDKRR